MNAAPHNILISVLVWLIPCVPAITLHECAHGWMALRFGDTTARDMGRLTLNPIRHVDPVGTVLLPAAMLLFHAPFVFGWAKPVPVNFSRLKGGRFGTFMVALAGPLTNLLMMFGWLAAVWVAASTIQARNIAPDSAAGLFLQIALSGVAINLVLILLNMLPIPPLDGGRIVGALLPEALARPYMKLERYGIGIILLLTVTGMFSFIFTPVLDFCFTHLGLM